MFETPTAVIESMSCAARTHGLRLPRLCDKAVCLRCRVRVPCRSLRGIHAVHNLNRALKAVLQQSASSLKLRHSAMAAMLLPSVLRAVLLLGFPMATASQTTACSASIGLTLLNSTVSLAAPRSRPDPAPPPPDRCRRRSACGCPTCGLASHAQCSPGTPRLPPGTASQPASALTRHLYVLCFGLHSCAYVACCSLYVGHVLGMVRCRPTRNRGTSGLHSKMRRAAIWLRCGKRNV